MLLLFSASTSLKAHSHSDPVPGCPDDRGYHLEAAFRFVITQNRAATLQSFRDAKRLALTPERFTAIYRA